ncbi:DUF6194 family protein [Rhodococcus sp. NPDC058505]|uniref:DUF6194 family protein n=1 Tax=Rhodococcus sp. NPDC058505 TaxID=3346531 RepID=UPI003660095C
MTATKDTWTLDETLARVGALTGIRVHVAGPETGAPEVAWGDVFLYPAGAAAPDDRFPVATIVTGDYPGFDTASDLDRAGVYRLNIHVGRDRFRDLLGYGPEGHAARRDDHDYREQDRLLPHPVYAAQAWVSVVNPGPRCGALAIDLIGEARERNVRRG